MMTVVGLILAMPGAAATDDGTEGEGCAVTPGGWGAEPAGNNPGSLLHDNFDDVFGAQLVVGDLVFEDAQDVTDAMPYTGPGSAFPSHAVALEINIAFGEAGLLEGSVSGAVVDASGNDYDGMTAVEVLAAAEQILLDDDDIEAGEYSDLIEAMTGFNEETFGCGDAPDCPTNVVAVAMADGSVALSWDAVDGAVEYNVYRGTDGGALVFLDSTTDTEYTDDTVAVGVTYEYMVTASDGETESGGCETVEVTAIPFFGAPLLAGIGLVGAVGAYRLMRKKP